MCRCAVIVLGVFLSTAAFGVEKPSGEEARKFIEYYYKGKAIGPLLTEMRICQEIMEKGTDERCQESALSVSQEGSAYIWMNFVVPKDTKEEIILQLEHGGIPRLTREFAVDSAMDYRVYEKVTLNKPGTWTAKVYRTRNGQMEKMGESQIRVRE